MKYGMIPFFIPHVGCPHVCTFCNQSKITETFGIGYLTPSYIRQTIEEYTQQSLKKSSMGIVSLIESSENRENHVLEKQDTQQLEGKRKYWEVCFYGGSFSAIPKALQEQLLQPAYEALQEGIIDGIRCSTRPDGVEDEALELLQSYGLTTVELGVQSMNDTVLILAKRGHTSDDVRRAVTQLRKFNMTVGLQILPGLLGDSWQTILETAVEIVKLRPDFVRIYPVLVIENTELAEQYKSGIYLPLTTEQALQYCSFLKTWFEEHQITVIRTGLQSTEELDRGSSLLAGPYEPAMGELVANEQWRQRIMRCIDEHYNAHYANIVNHYEYRKPQITCNYRAVKYEKNHKCRKDDIQYIHIMYPRTLTSKVRGLKNRNINYFNDAYESITFTWRENDTISSPICCIDGMKYML